MSMPYKRGRGSVAQRARQQASAEHADLQRTYERLRRPTRDELRQQLAEAALNTARLQPPGDDGATS